MILPAAVLCYLAQIHLLICLYHMHVSKAQKFCFDFESPEAVLIHSSRSPGGSDHLHFQPFHLTRHFAMIFSLQEDHPTHSRKADVLDMEEIPSDCWPVQVRSHSRFLHYFGLST